MIKLFLATQVLSVFLFACILIGEKIVKKNPNTNFARWWKNNIISEDPYN